MDERSYVLGFSVFPGVGPKRFSDLISTFGSAKAAWEGDSAALVRIIGKSYGNNFLRFREKYSITDYEEKLRERSVWYLTYDDEAYPLSLKAIANPPFVLYGKGDKQVLHSLMHHTSVGVVGTRKVTLYGRDVTEMLTSELVYAGCVIVSGLALGVDAIAHSTTIQHQGITIAVLGSGVDVCHPMSNLSIYHEIISRGGVVISEYPLGEPPSKGSFPSRNRIITGLSQAIVVTEGSEDSGALYTAHHAFEIGRPVFAVPGPITSALSKGPNALLRKGAMLITSGHDILEHLGHGKRLLQKKRDAIKGDTKEEQEIITLLQSETLLFDELVKRSGSDPGTLGVLLSFMEMKGLIKSIDGYYSLKA